MFQKVKKEEKQLVNQKKIKAGSFPRKQDQKFSKINKKFVKDLQQDDLEYLNE